MPLMVRCKECGFEHPSEIQMDQKSFEDPNTILENNSEGCWQCRKLSTYNKPDFYFKLNLIITPDSRK
jgi:hypothetical protein